MKEYQDSFLSPQIEMVDTVDAVALFKKMMFILQCYKIYQYVEERKKVLWREGKTCNDEMTLENEWISRYATGYRTKVNIICKRILGKTV